MIKLIATDMDGTFLDSQKQFSPEFLKLFYELKDKDIKFVIASGNQFYRLYQKFLPISEYMYFVAENGAYISEGAQELYCNVIDPQTVDRVVEMLEDYPRVYAILCGKKCAYVLKDYYEYRNEVKKYYCNYSFLNSYDEIDDDIMKIAIYDKHQKVNEIVDSIACQLPDDVKIVTSGNEWMDISNLDAHKGVGLQFLQMIYEIEPDECAAFGDQMNDFELLQQVKYGYAMSNAVQPIKDIAYEVIGSNDEQSVIKKIKEIIK